MEEYKLDFLAESVFNTAVYMQSTGPPSLNCSERTQTSCKYGFKLLLQDRETSFTSIVRQNFLKNRITRWENDTHLCSFLPLFL